MTNGAVTRFAGKRCMPHAQQGEEMAFANLTVWTRCLAAAGMAWLALLLVSLFPALAAPPAPRTLAPDMTTPVILHPASQEMPDVDGRRVVWQDFRYGPTDIFMMDLDSSEITNLTRTLLDQWEIFPDLDGDLVVWKDGYNGLGIHGMRLSTGQVFTVTEGHADVSRPHLSGSVVVWADNRAGADDWNVFGFDIDTRTEFTISDAPGMQMDPQIDGPWVVWWDDHERVQLVNLTTHLTQTVHPEWGARFPDVSAADGLVVWQDYRHGNWDIYGYDMVSGRQIPLLIAPDAQERVALANGLLTYQTQAAGLSWNVGLSVLSDTHRLTDSLTFAITDNGNSQVYPVVDGNTVVWQDSRNHQTDIYRFEWTGTMPPVTVYPLAPPTSLQVGAFPGYRMRLQWQDAITNETGFRIERARGITGTAWVELATLPANSTVYTDASPLPDESYWYRVRAVNADGYSTYSNDSFNSAFGQTPSLDEQYLMVLINEARADPAAFGYPGELPVPPLRFNPLLGYSAHSHSQSILNSNYQFGHCDPIGRCPTERAQAVGYTAGCAENLVIGGTGPAAVEGANQSFMDSEPHRKNMLAADLNEFGVGHTANATKGNTWFHGQFTEVFAGRDGVSPPVIPGGIVVPYTATVGTVFTYAVNFYNEGGMPPAVAQVVIDGRPYPLSLSSGAAELGTYRYITSSLGVSLDHDMYFWFEYGTGKTARYPTEGGFNLPDVGAPIADLQASLSVTVTEAGIGLHGQVSNAGYASALAVTVRVYLGDPDSGGAVISQTVLAELPFGARRALDIDWPAEGGTTSTFYLVVDPEQAIADWDFGNNRAQATVTVPARLYLPLILR